MRKNQTYSILFLGFFVGVFFLLNYASAAVTSYITIEDGNIRTSGRRVSLTIRPPSDARLMKVTNENNFDDAAWQNIDRYKNWTLEYGAGVKKVSVKFRDSRGREFGPYSDTIFLSAPRTVKADFEINGNDKKTSSRNVILTFDINTAVEKIEISNSSDFSDLEEFIPDENLSWVLSSGSGKKTVYVRFEDVNGNTKQVSKTIEYVQPSHYIQEGTIIKGQSETLYYLGLDGRIHPFLNLAVYHSWYKDFSDVMYVSDAKLQEYNIGEPVCLRAGTWLVKFPHSSRIYAVEPGCQIRPIRSETEAFILYGDTWQKRIIELDDVFRNFYTVTDISNLSNAEDEDQDGVDEDTEGLYNTSESKSDTDRDGVSDYEEIYFWFSDPAKKDTNSNGVSDSQEIRKGFSPVSSLPISELPEGSYLPPVGTVFYGAKDKKTMYYQYNGEYLGTITESVFKKYNTPTHFVSRTPFVFSLQRPKLFSRTDVKFHFTPSILRGKTLRQM